MIDAIRKFFETNLDLRGATDATVANKHQIDRLQLAAATLLIEVINSDHQQDEREWAEISAVLQQTLQLQQNALEDIIRLAKNSAHRATSLYEFTELINANYAYEEKLVLMESMWRVAYADSNLDRYEDHLIRKVSELIYVSHSDFIRTKLKVRDQI